MVCFELNCFVELTRHLVFVVTVSVIGQRPRRNSMQLKHFYLIMIFIKSLHVLKFFIIYRITKPLLRESKLATLLQKKMRTPLFDLVAIT